MDSPERSRSYGKKETEDNLDGKREITGDDDDLESDGKRRHRFTKSRRSGNGEDIDGWDSSGRRKSSGDRNESKRTSSGTNRGDLDEGDYDTKKDSNSKLARKKQEASSLEKLSNWYQDGEYDKGDKSGTRNYNRGDDSERNTLRKGASKFSDHESSHRRSSSRDERARDGEDEKVVDKDVKGRRRWDEIGDLTKVDDISLMGKSETRVGLGSESKHERVEIGERRDRRLESTSDNVKSHNREERRNDSDRLKKRSDDIEEDTKVVNSVNREDKIGREKNERNKISIEGGNSRRSRSPDRSGRLPNDLENSEMEFERGSGLKRKDLEKDNFREDRGKGRETSWSNNRDREGSRESWKRRQHPGNERDMDFNHDRDFPRRGRDRMDNDRGLGRTGNRKDVRSEAVKASTNFGISTENYDVIEIQPKPLDYGRDDSESGFSRRTEAVPLHDPKSNIHHDDRGRSHDESHRNDGNVTNVDESNVKYTDEVGSLQDQNTWKDEGDGRVGRLRGQHGSLSTRSSGSQNSGGGFQSNNSNQEPSNFGRMIQQGPKGNRPGRGGRIRPLGRDNPQVNIPLPIMGPPFGHLGIPPPGPMQPMNPGLSPGQGPGPPVPPGVFVPPFSPPMFLPGGRGVDIGMLPVSPLPPGPPSQRFPGMGAAPNPGLFFGQPGQGRGVPPNVSGPGFNAHVPPIGRGNSDKVSGGWVPSKSGGPPGKAPSRGEQNDYSQNFVDTGLRPQNFIRELEESNVEDYPKLRDLITKKDEIVKKASTPPMYYKCDLREFVLSPEFFGTKFDVILVDPPWEEYVHRAPGVTDHMEYWTPEEIMNLKIEAIADTPSFIFLWVGDGVGLEYGRQCLKKWGFRRCEDICWVKTNKNTATPALRHDSYTLFQHSKEHCLMGIKGTVRRSTDGHIIHANIDTDVIIAEEPPYGSAAKPEEMYRIIEHFALGRRRVELFGEDHNIREGWLTVGKELSSSNFNAEAYTRTFADKDGKVWQGGGGRNPPPDAPHLVQTTPEIEALRPKSPMKNQQQLQQQQSNTISLTSATSTNRRPPSGNSPQNMSAFGLNSEGSTSGHPPPWMEPFKAPNENFYDMFGYNIHQMPPPNGEFLDFEAQRMMNMM